MRLERPFTDVPTTAGISTTVCLGGFLSSVPQTYDGDGASRKRVQISRQNIYDDLNENHPLVQVLEDTQTSYYVKSSVLGDARIVELDVNGNKKSVWIYAGGQRIAKEENGSVSFEHHNPATGGWLETNGHSSFRTTTREERDIRNAEIPLSNPYPTGSYISMKWEQPLFIDGGDPFDYSGGYEIDGLPISEAQLAHMMDTGAAVGALFVGGRYAGALDFSGHGAIGLQYLRGDFGALRITTSFADVSSTFREWDSGGAIIDTGQETTPYPQLVNASSEYGERRFAHAPQNPTPTPTPTPQTPLHCQPDIIQAMKKAWQRAFNGTARTEAGFIPYRGSGGTVGTANLPNTNQDKAISFKISAIIPTGATALAIFHTHPNSGSATPSTGGPPSDVNTANMTRLPIYVISNRGLNVYDPATRKTTEVRDGLDWQKPCK